MYYIQSFFDFYAYFLQDINVYPYQSKSREFIPRKHNPNEKKIKCNLLYDNTFKKLTQVEEKLYEIISEGDKTLLKKLTDYQTDLSIISNQENFIKRFRLGVKLIGKCYDECDGDFIDLDCILCKKLCTFFTAFYIWKVLDNMFTKSYNMRAGFLDTLLYGNVFKLLILYQAV